MTKAEQHKHRSILAKKENNEYEQASEQIKIDIAKGAKVYIPELVEKLKKKYIPENELTEDEIHERNKQIVRRIHQDWNMVWGDTMITASMPDEIKNPERRNPRALEQLSRMRKSREIISLAKKALNNAYRTIETPPKEVIQEIKEEVYEEKITPDSGWKSTVTFGARETVEDELDTPEQLHDDAMRTYGRLWLALANKDHLPSDSTDVFVDSIKATRQHRARILKGLDPVRRTGFINQSVWIQMLVTDLIKMDQELTKEEKHYGR